ncbi:hypothetical protein C5748_05855 [Phyllobacterium phragmitis]|uniref:Mannose-6-phosphate isomerase n=1 Tax=Phyllobacterium phragmitis TaxID=2670329 RepID=A0A2S9IWI3_9HYPH|nr:AGE family epimerase/isomerase [Phyllobacterium phragmitis]PRD44896.1 hypothetical protein C5748_05855 [Phyllobacterium phragmitis]
MTSATAFATDIVPRWIAMAADHKRGGLVERLDGEGRPVFGEPKTTLVHARTVFSLAHLCLATGNSTLLDSARKIHAFMDTHLRHPEGGYRYAVDPDGSPREGSASRVRRTYDQSFVLLALVTLRKADPQAVAEGRIEELWRFIESLTEPATGALYEDDQMALKGAQAGDRRAQNPQMHMLEAVLQAYELTREVVWLERATRYVSLLQDYFIDRSTGSVRELVSHDLSPLEGAEGLRREPGHQYEWAWLLHRYADLSGDDHVRPLADRMTVFADTYGIRRTGDPLDGAPFDALAADGSIIEDTHLLWPLTEAGKLACMLHLRGDARAAARARKWERLIFSRFFACDRTRWVNQLDGRGGVIWPDALSRLIYHVALFVTEGARTGLWHIQPKLRISPSSSPQGGTD